MIGPDWLICGLMLDCVMVFIPASSCFASSGVYFLIQVQYKNLYTRKMRLMYGLVYYTILLSTKSVEIYYIK